VATSVGIICQGLATAVHTNGIHQVHIKYCCCELPSKYSNTLQLAQSRLFPATMECPETAFTFDVLNDFHLHSLTSKKAVMDYTDALWKHTNSAFPHNVPVCMLVALKSGSYLHHLRIGTENSIMSNTSGVILQLRGEPAKLSELTAFLHRGTQVL
jgi:CxC2 like cysteine cluster associated with KDZ transposases